MYFLWPLGRHRKGDFAVDSFLNYGIGIVPRLLTREDESSRKNQQKVRRTAVDRTRLSGWDKCECELIPAGTRYVSLRGWRENFLSALIDLVDVQ